MLSPVTRHGFQTFLVSKAVCRKTKNWNSPFVCQPGFEKGQALYYGRCIRASEAPFLVGNFLTPSGASDKVMVMICAKSVQ